MAINFTTKSNKKKTTNKQDLGFTIIFFALNFLLVPFSAIATYNGYKGFLDEYLAIILAAATALLFFGLNFIIMERRKKGQPHLKQVFGYILPLLISFFGNFTYFYGNQLEEEFLNEDLTMYRSTLKETYENAVSELNSSTGLEDLETRLKAELNLLKYQMETPPRGYGSEARRKWQNIQNLFSEYNKNYNNSNATQMTKIYNTSKYSNFENAAIGYFNTLKEVKDKEINRKVNTLTKIYKPLDSQATELLSTGNEDSLKSEGVDLIKNIKNANDEIGNKASGLIPDFDFKSLPAYNPINAKNINSVLESAFINVDDIGTTIFSFIMSLVIDLATLAFVFLSLSYKKIGSRNKVIGPKQL